jgi:hypothetical protein
MSLPPDFFKDLLGPVAGSIATIIVIYLWNKLVKQATLPASTAKKLEEFRSEILIKVAELGKKIEDFTKMYKEGAERNRKSQRTLFEVQDLQFSVMSYQIGALRELAHSVCNGNKESAMKLCDEADKTIAEGQSLQKDYLLEKL